MMTSCIVHSQLSTGLRMSQWRISVFSKLWFWQNHWCRLPLKRRWCCLPSKRRWCWLRLKRQNCRLHLKTVTLLTFEELVMLPTFEELVMLPFFCSDSAKSLIVVVNVSCHQQKKILWGFINCMAVTNLQYKTRCTLRKHGLKFCNTAISQTCQMHLY